MKSNESSKIKYFTFESFPQDKLNHGIFTRKGGISPDSFSSLNVGESAGDTRENVLENRKRIFNNFDRPLSSIYDVWQIHSDEIVYTKNPRSSGSKHIKADAILTDSKNVSLFMQFADCVPILVFDPNKNFIGIIHAGWQGTIKRIIQKTIQFMQENFLCKPEDIIAGIGPSIGPDHYEVGRNVVIEIEDKLSDLPAEVLTNNNGKFYFDLWKANRLLLEKSGVVKIETAEICTACNLQDWYSYRCEGQKSGRFGVFIGLK
jgi:YfiH family protein